MNYCEQFKDEYQLEYKSMLLLILLVKPLCIANDEDWFY